MLEENIKEVEAEIKELQDYYDSNIKGHKYAEITEEWEHYAEWYRELFGCRPVPVEFMKAY